jgi:uncharacterized protein (UPF0276 family)
MTLVGAAYRTSLAKLFTSSPPEVDCTEFLADRYFSPRGLIRGAELEQAGDLPVVIHGTSGNVASVTGPEVGYLEAVRRLCDYTHAIIYSDHVAFTGAHGRDLGHLSPNLFDDELLDAASRNVALINEVTGLRPCLENLAGKTMISGSKYTPEEFYLRLLDASDGWDCLLDLTNVWINAQNRPVDPIAFVEAIPPERVRVVHLAGGRWLHGELVDTHSQSVHEEVYPLLAFTLERACPDVVMVERDSNWENAYAEVQHDLGEARRIVEAAQGGSGSRLRRDLPASA